MSTKIILKLVVSIFLGFILMIALIQTLHNFFTLIRYKRLDLVEGDDERNLTLRLGKNSKEIAKHLIAHFTLTALLALLLYAIWKA